MTKEKPMFQELSITDVLRDTLIKQLMQADHVSRVAQEKILQGAAKKNDGETPSRCGHKPRSSLNRRIAR